MQQLDVVWDSETLDEFLAAPIQYVPGTYMGFAGIKDDEERRDLIAYMRKVSSSNECN
jgi:cytochrome c